MNGGALGPLRPQRPAGRGWVRGQGARRVKPALPCPLLALICYHPRPAIRSLTPAPPTSHTVPKPHPRSGELGALVQTPQLVPFIGEGSQDTAQGAVHCEGRGRPSDSSSSPRLLLTALQHTLTLLGQGPETALQVGIVWGWHPTGS